MASLKKVRFSTPLSDILASPPETSMECSENSQSSESSAPSLNINMGAISEEFNSIMEHELLIEEKTQDEESEASPHDEDMLSQEISSEPALFGDSIPIWKTHKQKERNEKKVKNNHLITFVKRKDRSHREAGRRVYPTLFFTDVILCVFPGTTDVRFIPTS